MNNICFSDARESSEIAIIDKLIQSSPKELQEKMLQRPDLKLDEAIQIATAFHAIKQQVSQFAKPVPDKEIFVNRVNDTSANKEVRCRNCGLPGHDARGNCPARNETCHNCKNRGHYARCCRSQKRKTFNDSTDHKETPLPKRQRMENHKKPIAKYEPINNVISVCNDGENGEIVLNVGGIPVNFLIDSGTNLNIIDDRTYGIMTSAGLVSKPQGFDPSVKFKGYGNDVCNQKLSFVAEVTMGNQPEYTKTLNDVKFYVIQGGSRPLLGKFTAISLDVLRLGPPKTGEIINNVRNKIPFPYMKGILVRFQVNSEVKPVNLGCRRIPVALKDAVKEKLNDLLETDIIERVKGYSEWCSPIVTTFKDNGELRLCIDMRQVNKAIRREYYPLPTFDDLMPRLEGAKIFTKLDIKSAFHQCLLDEQSRMMTTFITPWGRFRYKRLLFGVTCAPEIFQRIMTDILVECTNVIVFIDDILIYAITAEDHEKYLRKVLSTLNEYGILLNTKKCQLAQKEIIFLGHRLSGNGISPMEEKIKAVRNFRTPTNAQELKSFLGMTGYLMKFIPDYATINQPLRELTRKDSPFSWGQDQQESFDKLKEMLCNPPVLGYFNPKDKATVIADASPVGLGAVLVQENVEKQMRVISYISKSLTEVEQRYCQTEKEALALVWAVERLREYLLGIRFILITDCKALETIFKKPVVNCARIERWALRLQAFEFKVKYKSGKENLADSLSRLSCSEAIPFDEETECFIQFMYATAAVDIIEVEKATIDDPELQRLKMAIDSNDYTDLENYKTFAEEFGYTGDIIVRRDRIVVPSKLRPRMLELGHEGHPGVTVMKARLRDRCWWPKMDQDVEKHVRKCDACRLVALPDKPAPLSIPRFPSRPWKHIAIDFMGPLPNGNHVLVIVDYFSRYLEVEFMRTITADATIKALRPRFVKYGNPTSITLDNGRQFCSEKFKQFCDTLKIKLNFTTPYWPQANGEVERQNRTILKRLKIAYNTHKDLEREMDDFLTMYYTTPHSSTGKTPIEAMGRPPIRTKIPRIGDIEDMAPFTDFVDRDKEKKEKRKENEDKKRGAKEHNYKIGDRVLKKNLLPGHKLSPTFDKEVFEVVAVKGTNVTIKGLESGQVVDRNVHHLKKICDAREDTDEEDFFGFEEEEQ